jgi:hypothetical protein
METGLSEWFKILLRSIRTADTAVKTVSKAPARSRSLRDIFSASQHRRRRAPTSCCESQIRHIRKISDFPGLRSLRSRRHRPASDRGRASDHAGATGRPLHPPDGGLVNRAFAGGLLDRAFVGGLGRRAFARGLCHRAPARPCAVRGAGGSNPEWSGPDFV